jgi:hypothetical protein
MTYNRIMTTTIAIVFTTVCNSIGFIEVIYIITTNVSAILQLTKGFAPLISSISP